MEARHVATGSLAYQKASCWKNVGMLERWKFQHTPPLSRWYI
jgi:hypothetical protein